MGHPTHEWQVSMVAVVMHKMGVWMWVYARSIHAGFFTRSPVHGLPLLSWVLQHTHTHKKTASWRAECFSHSESSFANWRKVLLQIWHIPCGLKRKNLHNVLESALNLVLECQEISLSLSLSCFSCYPKAKVTWWRSWTRWVTCSTPCRRNLAAWRCSWRQTCRGLQCAVASGPGAAPAERVKTHVVNIPSYSTVTIWQ